MADSISTLDGCWLDREERWILKRSIREWQDTITKEDGKLELANKYYHVEKCRYVTSLQLASIEVTQGPTIDFVPGRKDSNKSPNEGRLPDAKQSVSLEPTAAISADSSNGESRFE
ncbi:L-ascorbate peroxidase 3, peroxisomal [Tanacetum coccineum]